jgi:hypothetical protein
MHLAPKPGHYYRRTDTKQLVGAEGFDADPCDLDVIRALDCEDLAPVAKGAAKAKAAKAAASKSKGAGKVPAAEPPPASED